MLRLKNIVRNEDVISAQYIPENSVEIGFLRLRCSDGKVLESKKTSYDAIVAVYFQHAVNALLECMDEEKIPNEKLVMWY